MLRIVLILLLVGLVLAFKFLPWWGLLLLAGGLALVSKLCGKRLLEYLLSLPFRAKGRVLRGAGAEVHAVRPVPAPPAPQDADDDETAATGPRQYYEIEVTITPQSPTGAFTHWEPDELLVIPTDAKPLSDEAAVCTVAKVQVLHDPPLPEPVPWIEDEEEDEAGLKFHGPLRLKLVVGVKEGIRRLAFAYYFEKFGTVECGA